MMENIHVMSSWGDGVLRLAAAMAGGMVLGINRELRGKPAGVRTHALVAIGSCITAMVASLVITSPGLPDNDALGRVMQGIITGVGFIGGGVILKMPESRAIQGLTTAASVWVTACISITFALGLWRLGLAGIGLTLVALLLGGGVEKVSERLLGGHKQSNHSREG